MKRATIPTDGDETVIAFELVSIDPTAAPNGGTGDDWVVYRISQGLNVITGYRCGSRTHVVAEVERIVVALNERQLVRRHPYRPPGRPQKRPLPRHKDSI